MAGIDTTFRINPALYPKMPFAPGALKPLMVMASSGLLVGVNPSVKAKSLTDFIGLARQQNLLFSSAGNGSPGHVAAAIFGDVAGAPVTHVPYKGNAPAVLAILSGEVQAGILATPAPVVEVLGKAMADALDTPAVKSQLQQLDLVIEKQSGTAAVERLAAARTRYARIVQTTGMKAD